MSAPDADPPMRAWIEELANDEGPEPRGEAVALPREPAAQPAAAPNRGLLSAVRAGGRLLLVQTELVDGPPRAVRSLVLAGGTAILKRQCEVAVRSTEELAGLVRHQHAALEAELRGRLARLADAKARTSREACFRLFGLGLEAYRRGDYATALARWREARDLSSDDTIAFSIRAAESRLDPA